jgi:ribonuclease VapC
MTLDTSALVAILFSEAGHLDLVDRILDADAVRVGAPTLAETAIVVSARWHKPGLRVVEALARELGVAVVPFGDAEWKAAATAYQRFGRGRHKAALNFGDCLAYAAASVAGDTLLYVGDDFALTDIRAA